MKCDVHGVEGCKAASCAIWLENKKIAELHEPSLEENAELRAKIAELKEGTA